MTKHQIVPGSPVTLHFSLSHTDGTETFSTFGDEPVSMVVGDGSLTDGMELALYGLAAGDTQRLTLTPDQAFGRRDEANVHLLPRNRFEDGLDLEPGAIVEFETPSGDKVAGTVVELDQHNVRVDFNHPLAGCEVIFRVEILDVGAHDADS